MISLIPKNVEKRLKLADIYSQIGDWSMAEHHLVICLKEN